MRRGISFLAVVSLAALTGCITYAKDVVKTRASREYDCPPQQVEVIELGGLAYKAKACGTEATYVCAMESAGGEMPCVKEGAAELPK